METEQTITEDPSIDELWDEIGFHKPMAGFWYKLIYQFIGLAISAFFMGYLISFFYPYPESFGYKDVVVNLFNLMFLIFDVGTASVMGRFIPEANIKNPEKMLHYVQYFIWYQMVTGLIQITLISIYALFYATESNLAYLVWLMLLRGCVQYPGFLNVFQNVLGALQQFHKREILNFLNGSLIQRLTELSFVYFGQLYGQAHPEVGEMLGIAIGASIGLYIDDFGTMAIAAYYFSKVVKKYGISPKHCFRVDFTWNEIKPVVIFSLKTQVPGMITTALDFLILQFWLMYVPQYTTIVTLAMIGGSIADTINWFNTPDITALVSEAYMNGKKQLVRYYFGQIYRFVVLMHGLFIPLILTLNQIMPTIWYEFNMINYIPGVVFIIPRLIKTTMGHYMKYPGQVLFGADKPEFNIFTSIAGKIVNTLFLWFLLDIVDVSTNYGIFGVAWVKECFELPASLFFFCLSVIYMQRKVIKVKIPWKQIIIGFILPSLIIYGLMSLLIKFAFYPLYSAFNVFIAIGVSILVLAIILIFVYFPLTALLGGWDKTNLNEFKKVTKMSGPSKIIVIPVYRLIEFASKRSKLHDKFGMEVADVEREAEELLKIKLERREELKQKLKKVK
ncbi:MAG: hypothetical protein GF364_17630 [Candidatus Lokiarchaeota archaeon]|nr:hypothetical protein [Candidatus Lokiarchaeota archaeon]